MKRKKAPPVDNDDYEPVSPVMKRVKIQAQRKFAQGSNNYSYSTVNMKEVPKLRETYSSFSSSLSPSDIDDLSSPQAIRPCTEDFLTFLCFRGTECLPQKLNLFNIPQKFIEKQKQKQNDKQKEPEEQIDKPMDKCEINVASDFPKVKLVPVETKELEKCNPPKVTQSTPRTAKKSKKSKHVQYYMVPNKNIFLEEEERIKATLTEGRTLRSHAKNHTPDNADCPIKLINEEKETDKIEESVPKRISTRSVKITSNDEKLPSLSSPCNRNDSSSEKERKQIKSEPSVINTRSSKNKSLNDVAINDDKMISNPAKSRSTENGLVLSDDVFDEKSFLVVTLNKLDADKSAELQQFIKTEDKTTTLPAKLDKHSDHQINKLRSSVFPKCNIMDVTICKTEKSFDKTESEVSRDDRCDIESTNCIKSIENSDGKIATNDRCAVDSVVNIMSNKNIDSLVPTNIKCTTDSVVSIRSVKNTDSKMNTNDTCTVESVVDNRSSKNIDSNMSTNDRCMVDNVVSIESNKNIDSEIPTNDRCAIDSVVGIKSSKNIVSEMPADDICAIDSSVSIRNSKNILSEMPVNDKCNVSSVVSIRSVKNVDSNARTNDRCTVDNTVITRRVKNIDNKIPTNDKCAVDSVVSIKKSVEIVGNEIPTNSSCAVDDKVSIRGVENVDNEMPTSVVCIVDNVVGAKNVKCIDGSSNKIEMNDEIVRSPTQRLSLMVGKTDKSNDVAVLSEDSKPFTNDNSNDNDNSHYFDTDNREVMSTIDSTKIILNSQDMVNDNKVMVKLWPQNSEICKSIEPFQKLKNITLSVCKKKYSNSPPKSNVDSLSIEISPKNDESPRDKKKIFQQRCKNEYAQKPTEAFSPVNEKSVYAFEPDLPLTSTPFRRTKLNLSPFKSLQSSNSIAVQVNMESEPSIECNSQPEISATVTDEGDRLYYIPLQTTSATNSNQPLIQGVAVKLGTEGPDQKIIMSATLVTQSPPTFSITNTTTIAASSLPCTTNSTIAECKIRRPLGISITKSTTPVGTVQPTARVNVKPLSNKHISIASKQSMDCDEKTPLTTLSPSRQHSASLVAKTEKSANSTKKGSCVFIPCNAGANNRVPLPIDACDAANLKKEISALPGLVLTKLNNTHKSASAIKRTPQMNLTLSRSKLQSSTIAGTNTRILETTRSVTHSLTISKSLPRSIASVKCSKHNAESDKFGIRDSDCNDTVVTSSMLDTQLSTTLISSMKVSSSSSANTSTKPYMPLSTSVKSYMPYSTSKSTISSSQASTSKPRWSKKVNSVKSVKKDSKEVRLFPKPGEISDAPTFYPTEVEFSDPMQYIESVRETAEKFGLCRIVPPSTFKPECEVADEMRFMAYNQYVHKMLYRWGPNVKQMMAIKKYLATQNITLTHPPWIGGIEIDLPRLYQTVQQCGGLKEVIEKERWQRVADLMKIPKSAQERISKLDDIYCKYLLPYDMLSDGEREKLSDQIEKEWKSYSKNRQDSKGIFDDIDECITKGRTMPLSSFYRIARNTMMMWFNGSEGENGPSVENIEDEFWNHVSNRKSHICVNFGSIDCGTHGYGFPVTKNSPFAKHPWNLKVLTNNNSSVLRSLGPIIGVTVPTLHVSMLYSACCWYRDPHGLPWIEYLHTGASKIWYGVADEHKGIFKQAMLSLVSQYCREKNLWLPSDTVMIPPNLLVKHQVPLSRTVQHPGQFIVVFPKSFTSTISTGYLVSESVYFAHSSWLSTAEDVFKDLNESCEPSVFSLEQLLISVATDPRANLSILKRVLPMLSTMRDCEVALRSQLEELGLQSSEHLVINKRRKSSRVAFEDEDNYECGVCRANLFLSLVINSHEQSNYCLHHAANLLYKKQNQVKYCKLMYAYTEDELENFIVKVKERIEAKNCKKSQHNK